MPNDKVVFICISNLSNNNNNSNSIGHPVSDPKGKIHSASDASSLWSGRIKQQNIYLILHTSLWLSSSFPLSHRAVPSQTTAMRLAQDTAWGMDLQCLSFGVRVATKVHQIAPSWQQLALVLSNGFSGRYCLPSTSRWMCLSSLSTSLRCITFMVACFL